MQKSEKIFNYIIQILLDAEILSRREEDRKDPPGDKEEEVHVHPYPG